MKYILGLVLIFASVGCDSIAITTVELSKDERTQAQAIAEKRQQINFQRLTVQDEYQAKMNRLAEQESDLNIEASKLCFEFKKAHRLEPNKNYTLDEWNGRLVKQ